MSTAAITAATAAIGVLAGEAALRQLVARRAIALLGEVVATRGATVELGVRPLLPQVARRRLDDVVMHLVRMELPEVALQHVTLHLRDVLLTADARIVGGTGYLDGHVPAADVLRMAGLGGALELREGAVTFRWPAPRTGRPSVGMRLKPKLSGDRVRLAPTPVAIMLPQVPPGTTITSVEADADTLLVTATIDLAVLFAGAS